ncbi:hypothetical protein G9A89_009173 [Geosiphon pyriformis]|nr:hypothetical protein G9A89_009173 [Geosiphon pyriformis]
MDGQQLPPSWRGYSKNQIEDLLNNQNEKVTQTTYYVFTTNHVFYFVTLIILSKLIEKILRKIDPNLSLEHIKNCTTYILEIIFTGIALTIQIIIYPVFKSELSSRNLQLAQICCLITLDLYIFELIYRKMRLPLIAHHFITMAVNIFAFYVIRDTVNLDLFTVGLIVFFQATTEQSTFLGLLFYRLKPSYAPPVLFFAAVQVFLAKFGTLIWVLIFWAKKILPNPACLFATQIWATYVVWVIALKSHRKSKNPKHTSFTKDRKQQVMQDEEYGISGDTLRGLKNRDSMPFGTSSLPSYMSRDNGEEQGLIEAAEDTVDDEITLRGSMRIGGSSQTLIVKIAALQMSELKNAQST